MDHRQDGLPEKHLADAQSVECCAGSTRDVPQDSRAFYWQDRAVLPRSGAGQIHGRSFERRRNSDRRQGRAQHESDIQGKMPRRVNPRRPKNMD